jgi:hypothetical protein
VDDKRINGLPSTINASSKFIYLEGNQKAEMIDYNLVLYIGLGLIVGGFCLFLYSQHRLRQLDIEQWKLNQSFNKAKKGE